VDGSLSMSMAMTGRGREQSRAERRRGVCVEARERSRWLTGHYLSRGWRRSRRVREREREHRWSCMPVFRADGLGI
jgi:hypothetical protein